MKMKIGSLLGVFFLIFVFFSLVLSPVFAAKPSIKIVIGANLKEYKPSQINCDIKVPTKKLTSIQAGINASVTGDAVCVKAGTYNEDIVINKSIRLSGKGADKTIINGQGSTWPGAVYITVKNAIFEGFFINGVGTNSTVQLDVADSPYDSTLRYNWMKAGNGGMTLQLDGFQNTLVQENILEDTFTIYPNPTSGVFNLKMSQFENVQMKIYNVFGEYIYQQFFKSFNSQIDLFSQPKGMYFIKLYDQDGMIGAKKIIINK